MQRLASTAWVESFIQSKIGKKKITLHDITLKSDYILDAGNAPYDAFVVGSTAIHANDVAYSMVKVSNQSQGVHDVYQNCRQRKQQGIFVAELGPFLRGMQVDTERVEIRNILGASPGQDAPRNIGDTLSFSSLDAALRRHNLMDWTPDGVVLSKLESPTDEPMKSIEMDARSAQLFNVAVQGPAISTSWTSDVQDYRLECQPMDKVFICLVADLSYNTNTDKMPPVVKEAIAARDKLDDAILDLHTHLHDRSMHVDEIRDKRDIVRQQMGACEAAGKGIAAAAGQCKETSISELAKYIANLETFLKIDGLPSDEIKEAGATLEAKKRELEELRGGWSDETTQFNIQMDAFEDLQERIRTGEELVGRAELTNFRLIRSTSSHMSNYSHFRSNNKSSRCGLRLGVPKYNVDEDHPAEGYGEYIVGAWCVGTVLDSAASRSTIGTLVHTAPTSMALNVSVNIEWWSGDKLYKHYMDASGTTLSRGAVPKHASVVSRKRGRADVDIVQDRRLSLGEDGGVGGDDGSDGGGSAFLLSSGGGGGGAWQMEGEDVPYYGRVAPGGSALPGGSAKVPDTAGSAKVLATAGVRRNGGSRRG